MSVNKKYKYKAPKKRRKKGQKVGYIRRKNLVKAVISTIISVVVVIFVVFALIVSFFVSFCTVSSQDDGKVNNIMGYSVMVVATGSMSPTILPGDVVIICNQTGYLVGDIITYVSDNAEFDTFTHRIVSVVDVNGTFMTQGDANNAPDEEYATPESIIGKVVYIIPQVGRVVQFIKGIPFWVIALISSSIIIVTVILCVKEFIRLKKKRTPEEIEMDEAYAEYRQYKKFEKRLNKSLKQKFECTECTGGKK